MYQRTQGMVRWSSLPLQPGTIHWTRLVVAQGNKMPWETTTTYNDNIYIIVADKGKEINHYMIHLPTTKSSS